jgi:hypothetical protein
MKMQKNLTYFLQKNVVVFWHCCGILALSGEGFEK